MQRLNVHYLLLLLFVVVSLVFSLFYFRASLTHEKISSLFVGSKRLSLYKELESIFVSENSTRNEENRSENDRFVVNTNPCNYDKEKGPRILCTIFTTSASHKTRMKAIHDTWSKRYFYL